MATAELAQMTEQNRFVLGCVDYETYKTVADALGERPFRATFDGRSIELMTMSPRHEGWKAVIGRLIDALTEELEIEVAAFGSMTMRREDLERGLEPDQCYYVQNEPTVHGRLDLDLEQDPPPDLAIEVEVSRSALDRMGIYARLGIGEVWRFDGEQLQVVLLNPSGTYDPIEASRCFPMLPMEEFTRFLRMREGTGDTQVVRAFRAWVRANLVRSPAAGTSPPPAVS
jgi:Uma2 family endonuclease